MTNEARSQQSSSPPPSPPPVSGHNPGRAALCALIPGVGAVYNREYIKGILHFSVFAGLTVVGDEVPVFVLAAISFYMYTIIDAYRSAEALASRGIGSTDAESDVNFPLWGGSLILMGVVFLLDNLELIDIRSASKFWPLTLIALGGYLIYRSKKEKGGKSVGVGTNVEEAAQMRAGISEMGNSNAGIENPANSPGSGI